MKENGKKQSNSMREPVKIRIEIVDRDNNPLFEFRPNNGNIACGLQRACEVVNRKLGIALTGVDAKIEEIDRKTRELEQKKKDLLLLESDLANSNLINQTGGEIGCES